MNNIQRNELFKEVMGECSKLLNTKGADYADELKDVLGNFKYTSSRVNLTKYQGWFIYFDKHIESIRNGINKNPNNPEVHSESLDSRFFDLINYAFLGLCLVREDREQQIPLRTTETIEEKRL